MAYKREVYEYVEKVYRDRQRQNEYELQQRREHAYGLSPKLRETDEALSNIGARIAQCVSGGAPAIKKLRAEIDTLRAGKRKILKELGLDEDYLDIKYHCALCCDTGINGGHVCKKCAEDELKKAAFVLTSLGRTLSDQSFDNFDLDLYSKTGEPSPYTVMKTNLEYCRSYCDSFVPGECLFMTGGTGLGKTHLSSAIAHELINKGISVCYVTATELFDRMEAVKFGRSEIDDTQEFYDADVLIIDDLGSEVITAFTVSALFSLVNSRINSGRSMIISTNFSMKDFEKNYNDKIASRILGNFETLNFTGSDIRLKRRQNAIKA